MRPWRNTIAAIGASAPYERAESGSTRHPAAFQSPRLPAAACQFSDPVEHRPLLTILDAAQGVGLCLPFHHGPAGGRRPCRLLLPGCSTPPCLFPTLGHFLPHPAD